MAQRIVVKVPKCEIESASFGSKEYIAMFLWKSGIPISEDLDDVEYGTLYELYEDPINSIFVWDC